MTTTEASTRSYSSDPLDGYFTKDGITYYDRLVHGGIVLAKFERSVSRSILEDIAGGNPTAEWVTEDMMCQAAEDALVAIEFASAAVHELTTGERIQPRPLQVPPSTRDGQLAARQLDATLNAA